MKNRTPGAACLFIAAVMLFSACDATRRHTVLSFFFDGVPEPESGESPEMGLDAESGTPADKKFYQHGPFAARLCTGCHKQRTNQLVLPEEELCLFCHTLPENYTKLHGPLAAGGCTVCHDPHGTPSQALLVSDSRDFCLYCHDKKDVMKLAVHRETGETCTTCHDSHGGNNDYFLKSHNRDNSHTTGQPA